MGKVEEIDASVSGLLLELGKRCWGTEGLVKLGGLEVDVEIIVVVKSAEVLAEMVVFKNLHSIQLK